MAIVSFKCSEAEKAELEVRGDGNVSMFIKDQLFQRKGSSDELLYRVLARLDELEDNIAPPPASPSPTPNQTPSSKLSEGQEGMLLEVLLLLRSVVKSDSKDMVQKEVERNGLPVWEGKGHQ